MEVVLVERTDLDLTGPKMAGEDPASVVPDRC